MTTFGTALAFASETRNLSKGRYKDEKSTYSSRNYDSSSRTGYSSSGARTRARKRFQGTRWTRGLSKACVVHQPDRRTKGQLDKLHQKFFDQTAQLRTQISAKHSELNILMNTSNPDLEKAKAIQKELSDLKGKMGQERINLYGEERKIDPNTRFGMGYGRGMGGPGRGMGGFGPGTGGDGPGMGWHRGGFGKGPCWN